MKRVISTFQAGRLAALLPPPHLLAARLLTGLVMFAILAVGPAGQALAQSGAGVADAFTNIVTTIVDIIQSLAIVVSILGVSYWGFGRLARPIFPEISQLTNQYVQQFLVGLVAVFLATTVVEALADAISGSV